MSRFANLSDRAEPPTIDEAKESKPELDGTPPSRVGRKAIAGYFSPEMSLAMHTCARRNGMSLQGLMAEAFDDVLRKYGESPVGR
ncbi:MAG: ribbon-helix-helix domain-containing protein [Pseudomonadota bacterium]|nr:ribbon-helix-helix domain-containing protein [Pseudomonadota bacterium]